MVEYIVSNFFSTDKIYLKYVGFYFMIRAITFLDKTIHWSVVRFRLFLLLNVSSQITPLCGVVRSMVELKFVIQFMMNNKNIPVHIHLIPRFPSITFVQTCIDRIRFATNINCNGIMIFKQRKICQLYHFLWIGYNYDWRTIVLFHLECQSTARSRITKRDTDLIRAKLIITDQHWSSLSVIKNGIHTGDKQICK